MTARLQRRVVEIDTTEEFDAVVANASNSMDGWRVRSLDLTGHAAALLGHDPAGALFLGCTLTDEARDHLYDGGALVFPEVPGIPIDPYRGNLYSAEELYAGLGDDGYEATRDARAYAWSQQRSVDSAEIVSRALHDAAIEAALDAALSLRGAPVVGVMGGHGTERGSGDYRRATELGKLLATDGFVVATGGGPGSMEAANLGAYFAGRTGAELDAAIGLLATVPSFKPSIGDWAAAAIDVRRRWPPTDAFVGGVGVPTWFYGHEPPNLFAAGVAKFFQNSVREATLVNRCTAGVVFLPGAAGTVQEIFQDTCENYYAAPELVAPMVLVGVRHWTVDVPVWPLLTTLSTGRGFAAAVSLVDDVETAAMTVAAHQRPTSAPSGVAICATP